MDKLEQSVGLDFYEVVAVRRYAFELGESSIDDELPGLVALTGSDGAMVELEAVEADVLGGGVISVGVLEAARAADDLWVESAAPFELRCPLEGRVRWQRAFAASSPAACEPGARMLVLVRFRLRVSNPSGQAASLLLRARVRVSADPTGRNCFVRPLRGPLASSPPDALVSVDPIVCADE